MPGDGRAFEQVARFCHGRDPAVTSRNAVPLFCLARYLGMTEEHSPGNLLARVSGFIRDEILPSWSETVEAFTSSEAVIEAAAEVGLADACVASIVSKAASDPRRVEDLTALPLRLYERVVVAMIRDRVLSRHVASSISQYVKKWVSPFVSRVRGKEVIEAVERMLPEEGGVVPCAALLEMLRLAVVLDVRSACRDGLERRVGRRLDLATAKDLVILLRGDAKEAEYDVDCVKRMLKIFYGSFADKSGSQERRLSGLVRVAALMEEFLAEVAGDEDLKPETFTQLAELAAAASSGTNRCSDGVYRAINIFLTKHGTLTEVEQDKVCRVLDCRMMSPEAVEHAATNARLPLRVVVHAVLADQMRLRSVIARAEEERERTAGSKTETKVTEMGRGSKRKEKSSRDGDGGIWKEMKRKFGCISSRNSSSLDHEHDCDCQQNKRTLYSLPVLREGRASALRRKLEK
uniref:NPH3 domain-containing protein n=1 Tax=Kalanchoe fedtschenkoi TaxID=63787 RepID=A0A7N0UT63_KALFE